MLPNIKSLEIDLKLPLATYEALESPEGSWSSSSQPVPYAWLDLLRTFQSWTKLRSLHIRLDHADLDPWSLVNERAILSPVRNLQPLQMTIALPKLNPMYESSDRHFIYPESLPIQRHYRQQYHVTGSDDGMMIVEYKPDFPIWHQLADLQAVDDKGHKDLGIWEVVMIEVEESERAMILRGEDPYAAFDALVR